MAANSTPATKRAQHFAAGPSRNIAAQQAPHDGQRRAGNRHQARNIQRGPGPKTLAQPRKHQRDRDHSDRKIDPEHPPPSEVLADEAADGGADDQGKSGHAAEDAERPGALFPGKGAGKHRHPDRHHQCGACALHEPRRDQPAGAAGQRTGHGGEREQGDARGEQPPSPETVAKRRAGQQQDRETQIIGVDRPLQRLDRCVEVGANGGKGRGHDQRVQRHHEGCQRGHAERPVLFPSDRKLAASSFSICLTPAWRGASCTGRTGTGQGCGPKYFLSGRILWRVPNVTAAGRDDDLASREPAWSMEDETDLDQVQDKAGNGRPERGLDRGGVCRTEGGKARRRPLSFAAARRRHFRSFRRNRRPMPRACCRVSRPSRHFRTVFANVASSRRSPEVLPSSAIIACWMSRRAVRGGCNDDGAGFIGFSVRPPISTACWPGCGQNCIAIARA